MSDQDHLEIIKASGAIEFYPLDPYKGITNIGRHPENDVVFDTPGVAPFHAVIDHRRKPYHLVVLSHDGYTTLGGQFLPPNMATPLYNWDNIQLDGHTIILIENEGAVVVSPTVQTAPPVPYYAPLPSTLPPPTTRPEESGFTAPLEPTRFFAAIPPDLSSEAIVIELTEREQVVEVEQTARYALTLINGGSVVAMFTVGVTGIDPDWVTVFPAQVNLYEGERTTVTITVTPPRQPTSQAGSHPFALVVSSPNYPSQRSQRGVMLTINPYYDFTVGELAPKRQSISWFKHAGKCTITIINKGNSEAPFRVDGQDDERTCSFEFEAPGEAVGLARQVDLRVLPEETLSIPMSITPHSRRLVGLRSRTHNFTVTTTLLEGQQTPRSQLGELRSAPLIGPWSILLMTLLVLSLIWFFFDPRVDLIAHPAAVPAGQQITLGWNTWPPFLVSVKLNDGAATQEIDPRGSQTNRPIKTTVYEVTADTWLSKLFTPLMGRDQVTVQVTPVRPDIGLFRADPPEVSSGQATILSWFVVGADELKLINNTDGTEEVLAESSDSRPVTLEKSTSYTLKAVSNSVPEEPIESSVTIAVTTPTPVPLAPPNIELFLAQPAVITAGEAVTLQWVVTGADSVSVTPLGDKLPPVGPPVMHKPQETTLYVLTASNGQETVNAVQQVVVEVAPTPTPTPPPGQPPVIEFLGVTPEEWTRVEDDRDDKDNEIKAQINWVVTGDTTNVELTGGPPGFEKLSNLARTGEVTIKVRDTTVFILTAYNGEAKAVKTTQIKFLDPTPTPDEGGDGDGGDGDGSEPQITSFTAVGVSSSDQVTQVDDDPLTYEVVAGSNVNLAWEVENADTVILVGVGEQASSGTYTLKNVIADQTFQLTATSSGGTVKKTLKLEVVAKATPPIPYNVNGTVSGDDIILTWSYDAENDIIGFRVYRAPDEVSPFARVADEAELGNGTRQWVDEGPLPTCTVYYVTAVYIDPLSGDKLETAASANTWYSAGCP